ncbi:recombinase family protein [Sphingobium sp. AS12]|uniref:recombinase family protein n=1 Tax=Sphingobium sp. AS12 TaxID=2849495 RepID=UPI001C31D0E9|nr:recombinase family protein [Sphingobium sp. AS12]
MDALLYIRWSSQEQNKGDSHRRQLLLGEKAAKLRGWSIRETLIEDGRSAYHGRNRDVGGKLAEIEERSRLGTLDGWVLLVEQLDRLSRQQPLQTLNLITSLTGAGVTIFETSTGRKWDNESVRSSWTDLLEAFIRAGLAFDESDKKSKRIKSAWEATRERGATKEGDADPRIMPGWMKVVDGRYSVIDARADWIKSIFRWCIEGVSLMGIARRLNADPKSRWTAGSWAAPNISQLIKARNVLGEYLPQTKDESGKRVPVGDWTKCYPAIIDEPTWQAAQAALGRRASASPSSRNRRINILAGVAVCGACFGPLFLGTNTKSARRLLCRNRHQNSGCHARTTYHYPNLERGVLDHVLYIALPETAGLESQAGVITSLELSLQERVGRLGKLVDSFSRTGSAAMERGILSLEREIAVGQEELARLRRKEKEEVNRPAPTELMKRAAELRGRMNDDDSRSHMNQLLRALVSSIVMDPTNMEATVILLGGIAAIKLDKHGNKIAEADAKAMLLDPEGRSQTLTATIGTDIGYRVMLDQWEARTVT